MNPDFAIILNFKITGQADADFLVKTARNIGARAVMSSTQAAALKQACAKYTIYFANEQEGLNLDNNNVIDVIVNNRRQGQNTIINIAVVDNQFEAKTQMLLDTINSWMHSFGHALNEGQPSQLKVDCGFILENRHANYQKYLFLKKPLPKKVSVIGFAKKPNRVEWIENRKELDFQMNEQKLTINLTEPTHQFEWQVLRIQAHRPEDDIIHTEF